MSRYNDNDNISLITIIMMILILVFTVGLYAGYRTGIQETKQEIKYNYNKALDICTIELDGYKYTIDCDSGYFQEIIKDSNQRRYTNEKGTISFYYDDSFDDITK